MLTLKTAAQNYLAGHCRSRATFMNKFVTLLTLSAALSRSALAQDPEVADAAEKLSRQISQAGKKTIAIANFSNVQDFRPQFSDYIVDQLGVLLAGAGRGFEVVTRSRLSQIMSERQLKFANEFDLDAFQKLGKFAGADAILAGSYRVLGSAVRIQFQLLDVSKGTIIAGVISNIPKTRDVDELLGVRGEKAEAEPGGAPERKGREGAQQPPSRQPRITLPPKESVRPVDVNIIGFRENRIGLYRCMKSGEVIVCFFVVTRLHTGNEDYDAASPYWNSKLVDNFNTDHAQVRAYFVDGRGQPQQRVNLGGDDSAWLAEEFRGAAPDITSGRIVFSKWNFQFRARVE